MGETARASVLVPFHELRTESLTEQHLPVCRGEKAAEHDLYDVVGVFRSSGERMVE